MSRVRPDHRRCCSTTWICMCGHTNNSYISKFHQNPFRGFKAHRGLPFPLPLILWLLAFTTAGTNVPDVTWICGLDQHYFTRIVIQPVLIFNSHNWVKESLTLHFADVELWQEVNHWLVTVLIDSINQPMKSWLILDGIVQMHERLWVFWRVK